MKPINLRIAEELGVREQQVATAISLLDGGATVPFVGRYRKEATWALDDAQLRTLEERLRYLRELDERRAVILDSISQQGKLDAALKHAIDAADSKARLEDLYLPYRPISPSHLLRVLIGPAEKRLYQRLDARFAGDLSFRPPLRDA